MLTIGVGYAAELRKQAEKEYPAQCCGALLGHTFKNEEDPELEIEKVVEEIYPVSMSRQLESRLNAGLISDQEQDLCRRYAASKGKEVLGFYRSAPDQLSRPTDNDLSQAQPGHSYIIISVTEGLSSDPLTSWILSEEGRFFNIEAMSTKFFT